MAVGDPADQPDWYRVLGVGRQASSDRIREAYRDLAWRLHPDRRGAASPSTDQPTAGNSPAEVRVAERRMREVNEAFRVLGEPARRRAYDHGRSPSDTPKRAQRSAPGSAGRSGAHRSAPQRNAKVPEAIDDGMVSVAGDGIHGVLVSRLVPAMLAVVLLGIVVFSAFAGGNVDESAPSDPQCVLGNTLVNCAKPNDGRIVGFADAEHQCPPGSHLVTLAAEYCVES